MKDDAMRQTALRSLYQFVPFIALLGLGAGACSVLVDSNATQCETNADCSEFVGAVCSKEKVCISGLEAACTTNQECVARAGKDYVCAPAVGACRSLRSPECHTIVGTPAPDDALIIGAIGPTAGIDEAIGVPIENAIRVAINDFQETSAQLEDKPRPLVLVGCNDDSSLDTGLAAAKHLMDVGAPAVIGAAFSTITLGVADVTIKAESLLISPSATAVGIGSLVDHSLVWRTAPSDTYQAHAIALYVDQHLKPQIGASTLKVAVLHRGDPYGAELSKAFEDELILNGNRPTDPSNTANYLRFDYGAPDDPVAHPPRLAEAVSAAIALEPHIIVLAGYSEAVTDIFVQIEKGWPVDPANPAAHPRPHYVMTHAMVGASLWGNIGNKNDLRVRVTGTMPGRARTNPLFQAFSADYKKRFSDEAGAEVFGASEAYDATYLIAYAAATLGDGPVTGQKLAQGLGKLVPAGTAINAGIDGIPEALELLRAGKTIDFTGASGPLDFDLGKGEAAADIQIWCLPAGLDGRAQSAALSGLYLDATDETALHGAISPKCH